MRTNKKQGKAKARIIVNIQGLSVYFQTYNDSPLSSIISCDDIFDWDHWAFPE